MIVKVVIAYVKHKGLMLWQVIPTKPVLLGNEYVTNTKLYT
jgi:hypothetical protein